jgi:hypothetical protein
MKGRWGGEGERPPPAPLFLNPLLWSVHLEPNKPNINVSTLTKRWRTPLTRVTQSKTTTGFLFYFLVFTFQINKSQVGGEPG